MARFEIYNTNGIPMFIKYDGSLSDLVNLVGRSEIIWGHLTSGEPVAMFVRRGECVSFILETTEESTPTFIVPKEDS